MEPAIRYRVKRPTQNAYNVSRPLGCGPYTVQILRPKQYATTPTLMAWKDLPHAYSLDSAERSVARLHTAHIPARAVDFLGQLLEVNVSPLALGLICECRTLLASERWLTAKPWHPDVYFGTLNHAEVVALIELVSFGAFVMDVDGYLLAKPEILQRLYALVTEQGGLVYDGTNHGSGVS